MPILRGRDGSQKMGKSLGNYIGVGEPPLEQFGKTMSIPDDLMEDWFQLLTDRPMEEVRPLVGERPMEAKKLLGREIVAFYHGADAARTAQAEWEKQFSQRQDPSEIPEAPLASSELTNGKIVISKLLTKLGLTSSNGEARRLILQGGVTIGPERTKITDPLMELEVADGLVVRVGNRKLVQVRVT
jgi:tyrosyl-tRNA synthetase